MVSFAFFPRFKQTNKKANIQANTFNQKMKSLTVFSVPLDLIHPCTSAEASTGPKGGGGFHFLYSGATES